MSKATRILVWVGISIVLVFALFVALRAPFRVGPGAMQRPLEPNQPYRGGEWLSWSPNERSNYIRGYLFGRSEGILEACRTADLLFEVDRRHTPGDKDRASDLPSARCLARANGYSKYSRAPSVPNTRQDFSAYTDVITEFYSKYPEYRSIPFPYLMDHLSDEEYRSAEQLAQMAQKRNLATVW